MPHVVVLNPLEFYLDGSRWIAGAALDVRAVEPPPPDDQIYRHGDVLVTPHAAAFTDEAIEDLRGLVVEYMAEALAGAQV